MSEINCIQPSWSASFPCTAGFQLFSSKLNLPCTSRGIAVLQIKIKKATPVEKRLECRYGRSTITNSRRRGFLRWHCANAGMAQTKILPQGSGLCVGPPIRPRQTAHQGHRAAGALENQQAFWHSQGGSI